MTDGTVLGFRVWLLQRRQGQLMLAPIHRPDPWRSNQEEAVCAHDPAHTAPAEGCSCGIYAAYSPEALETELHTVAGRPFVYGVVELGGRLVRYEHGFRAERAQIRRLIASPVTSPADALELEERYGVPAVLADGDPLALLAAAASR